MHMGDAGHAPKVPKNRASLCCQINQLTRRLIDMTEILGKKVLTRSEMLLKENISSLSVSLISRTKIYNADLAGSLRAGFILSAYNCL